uniref:Kazal-like domain-containing protein n=1 Tax=Coturnix japonica TaxID=93934 RepID=A0A8C2TL59_COTJA
MHLLHRKLCSIFILLNLGDCSACVVPRNFCSQEHIPHCGSDGITYASKCWFLQGISGRMKINLFAN